MPWWSRSQLNLLERDLSNPAYLKAEINRAHLKSVNNSVNLEVLNYWLKLTWGILLALSLGASIGFQFWLSYQVGKGNLDFAKYGTFINIVIGENFLQVIGLCTIVINYLFPKNK